MRCGGPEVSHGVVPKPAEDVFTFLTIIAEVLTPAMDAPAA